MFILNELIFKNIYIEVDNPKYSMLYHTGLQTWISAPVEIV